LSILEKNEGDSLTKALSGPEILRRPADFRGASTCYQREYALLGLEHLNLGYAGFFAASNQIHSSLAALKTCDFVIFRREEDRILVCNKDGERIAALSKTALDVWTRKLSLIQYARVFAMVRRSAEQDEDPERQKSYRVSEWEVPVIEVVTSQSNNQRSTNSPTTSIYSAS
jgi:hypothetical protein